MDREFWNNKKQHQEPNTHYDKKKKSRSQNRWLKSAIRGSIRARNMQRMRDHTLRLPVSKKAEDKHSINDLELFVVVWALQHLEHYLLGHHLTVKTDHRALLSIFKERTSFFTKAA